MIGPGTGVRVYLACGVTDMRKGIEGLSMLAQDVLRQKPTGGAVFAFRGRRGDRVKLLYFDGQDFAFTIKSCRKGVSLAFSGRWDGSTDSSAAGDAMGRNRLETSGLGCSARPRRLILSY